jgi:hypothetical protein
VTFGHSAAQQHRTLTAFRQSGQCSNPDLRLSNWEDCLDKSVENGTGAAVFWPLYWSWEAFSHD